MTKGCKELIDCVVIVSRNIFNIPIPLWTMLKGIKRNMIHISLRSVWKTNTFFLSRELNYDVYYHVRRIFLYRIKLSILTLNFYFLLGRTLLTQHSLNCLALKGDVKFSPHVSFFEVSLQYTKHSDACPILVPMSWM